MGGQPLSEYDQTELGQSDSFAFADPSPQDQIAGMQTRLDGFGKTINEQSKSLASITEALKKDVEKAKDDAKAD